MKAGILGAVEKVVILRRMIVGKGGYPRSDVRGRNSDGR